MPKPNIITILNPTLDHEGQEVYKSKDYKVFCVLAALGHTVLSKSKEGYNNHQVFYSFLLEDIQEDLAKLHTGSLLIDPLKLFAAYDNFKMMLNA